MMQAMMRMVVMMVVIDNHDSIVEKQHCSKNHCHILYLNLYFFISFCLQVNNNKGE